MCDDHILSELSDSALELPTLEFEEDDVDLDEALVPGVITPKRDILIEVDENFKKVITLDKEPGQDLKSLFRKAVVSDPAFRHYSYEPFKFQIFCEKFDTWVDFDNEDSHLKDGTHLKAVFRNDIPVRHSRHKRKSSRRDSSPRRRKKKRKSSRRRHRVSSDEEHETYKSSSRKAISYRSKSSSRRRYSSDDGYEPRNSKRSKESCSSDDEYEARNSKRSRKSHSSDENSKRSRKSCSSDEERSLVTTTVLDEPNNTPYRERKRQHNVSDNYYSMQYNRCSVSSTTLTVSNYVVSHVKNEAYDESEEGEMRDEDSDSYKEIMPASQGELYRLSLGLAGKNPVSALYELCAKLQYDPPMFQSVEESYAPDPKFLIQVTVQGKTYIPEEASYKKKEAKKLAAEYCLKKLGIYE